MAFYYLEAKNYNRNALDEAIMRELRHVPDPFEPTPRQVFVFDSLGIDFHARYWLTRVEAELTKAIWGARIAVDVTPRDFTDIRTTRLLRLGARLFERYVISREANHWKDAMLAIREALHCSPMENGQALAAHILGNLIMEKYMRTGRRTDFRNAMRLLRWSVELVEDPVQKADFLVAVHINQDAKKYRKGKDTAYAVGSPSLGVPAVSFLPPSYPPFPHWLHAQAAFRGNVDFIFGNKPACDAAIGSTRRILESVPEDDESRPRFLYALATALGTRALLPATPPQDGLDIEAIFDLDESIELHEAALKLTPRKSCYERERSVYSNALQNQLVARYVHGSHDVEDIRLAKTVAREMHRQTPTGHPERPGRMNNLAYRHLQLAATTGNLHNLRLADGYFEAVMQELPTRHGLRNLIWYNVLSKQFLARYLNTWYNHIQPESRPELLPWLMAQRRGLIEDLGLCRQPIVVQEPAADQEPAVDEQPDEDEELDEDEEPILESDVPVDLSFLNL